MSGVKQTSLPTISIVTPSLNQGAYLRDCIESLLDQGYPKLEYLILDGGSRDHSVAIIKRYAKYLTWHRTGKDGGQYFAVNEGLNRTTGTIMGWCNADDKHHENSLFKLAWLFTRHPHADWITGRHSFWDESGNYLGASRQLIRWNRNEAFQRLATGNGCIQQESTFWRRSLWETAGGIINTGLTLAGDFELWVRFFRFSRLYTVDTLLAGLRQHENQRSRLLVHDYLRECNQVIAFERSLARTRDLPDEPPPAALNLDQAGFNDFLETVKLTDTA